MLYQRTFQLFDPKKCRLRVDLGRPGFDSQDHLNRFAQLMPQPLHTSVSLL